MSLWLQIVVYTVGGAAGLAVLIALFKTGRPVRSLAGSGVQGLCALAAVNLAGAFTGVSLGFSPFAVACGTALGIPGVISLLLMRLILQV